MKPIKNLLKYVFLWLIGGGIYYYIEMLLNECPSYTSFVLGGACFTMIGILNEITPWEMYIEIQILVGFVMFFSLECIMSLIIRFLRLISDFTPPGRSFDMVNIMDLRFLLIWIILITITIFLDDYIRYYFLKEDKPKYKSYIFQL